MQFSTCRLRFANSILIGSLGVFLLLAAGATAQTNAKTSIWILAFEHDSTSRFTEYTERFRSHVVKAFLNQGQFAVVEREQNKLVEAERELQKSESFIDGKIVEQSRAIGAEYLLSGFLETGSGLLTLKITSVADQQVVESQTCELRANLIYGENNVATSSSWKKINEAVQTMLNRWLAQGKLTLVRVLETKKDKAQKILVAGGSAKGIHQDAALEIFYVETEQIDGQALERFVPVGKARVEQVENANFSNAKVQDGGEVIPQLLAAGKKLYCRLRVK